MSMYHIISSVQSRIVCLKGETVRCISTKLSRENFPAFYEFYIS